MEFEALKGYRKPIIQKINEFVFLGFYKPVNSSKDSIVIIKNCKKYEQEVILYTNTFTVLSKEIISLLNQRKKIKNKRKKKVLAPRKKV